MKVSDLNKDIQNIKNQKPLSNENKDKLRNVLTNVFDVIEKFERNGVIDKNSTQKIDFLHKIKLFLIHLFLFRVFYRFLRLKRRESCQLALAYLYGPLGWDLVVQLGSQ